MKQDTAVRQDRIDELAESFVARYRKGERPSVDEYLQKYPDLADELRELLPALVLLEREASLGHTQGLEGNNSAGEELTLREIGDFTIIREIGRGGMGTVYEALQKSLSRRVALKVLPVAATLDKRALQRFCNETVAVAQLDHPNIVDVYGVGSDRGVHFYAMRYIEGATLADIIDELAYLTESQIPNQPESLSDLVIATRSQRAEDQGERDGGTSCSQVFASHRGEASLCDLPSRDTAVPRATRANTRQSFHRPAFFRSIAELGIHVAEALDHAHQSGVIHRDIKPSNLIVDVRGKAWVTDFGLARIETAAGLTMTGDLLGTLRYMSPEQVLAKRLLLDHRTDIYSLGVTLYELVALRPAFPAEERRELLQQIAHDEPPPLHRLNASVPRELETIIGKAMAKSPGDRYATAQDLADDLRRFLDDKPIIARPPSLANRVAKWSRRHKPLMAAALLLVALASVGSAVSALLLAQERDKTTAALAESEEQKRQLEVNAQQLKQERRRAEAHFQKAREAVDRMFTRAAQEMAVQPHMNQIRRRLLEDALEFYQEFLKTKGNDDGVRNEAAMTHQRVGQIYRILGKYEEAIEHYAATRDIVEELVRKFPNEPQYRQELADVHSDWAFCEVLTSRPQARLEHQRKTADVYRALHNDYPADQLFARRATDSHAQMAMALQAVGRYKEAIDEWKTHKDLIDKWRRDFPQVPDSGLDPSFYHHWYGTALDDVGDVAGAEREYRTAHEIRIQRLRDKPDDAGRKHDLAHIKAYLAGLVRASGRPADAVELCEQAALLCDACLDQFPENADYLLRKGSTLNDLTEALADSGRIDDALAAQQRLMAFYDRVTRTEVNPEWIRSLRARNLYNTALRLEAGGAMQRPENNSGKELPA